MKENVAMTIGTCIQAQRVMVQETQFPEGPGAPGFWPASWIADRPVVWGAARVVAFRLKLHLDQPLSTRVHVTADQRYELFADGQRIGRGSERGDAANWFFESYDLNLPAGDHVLVARVWWLSPETPAPYAQMGVRLGFLLAAEGNNAAILSTGTAPWECRELRGYQWLPAGVAWGCGAKLKAVGECMDFGWEAGGEVQPDSGAHPWQKADVIAPAITAVANDQTPNWRLRPAMLPPMLEETIQAGRVRHVADAKEFPFHDDPYQPQPVLRAAEHLGQEVRAWQDLVRGEGEIEIPAGTQRRVIVDLEQYYCAYPELVVSGGRGSLIRVSWAESLYERLPRGEAREWIGAMPKGDRNVIDGKFFHGVTDEFTPDGGEGRRFDTLWWEAGRYVQILVRTGEAPLRISALRWRSTHYPIEYGARFACDDAVAETIVARSLRALLMTSHETFNDCPYYEQIMYLGDTRLEALVTYIASADDRLCRKAIEMFDVSRDHRGLTHSRYPSRVTQHIWGFSLWWVGMIHDFAMWRDDLAFVRSRLPGMRATLDAALASVGEDGLVRLQYRPNYTWADHVRGWKSGVPPMHNGASAIFTLLLALALRYAAELESLAGEEQLHRRWTHQAQTITDAAVRAFWVPQRGIFADDLTQSTFSEHAQVLALLAGGLPAEVRQRTALGLHDPDLTRVTIFFSHYLFETYRRLGCAPRMFDRIGPWRDAVTSGILCLPEMPEPSRSDCHAWGSHVIHHFLCSILGIRPAGPGFARVRIEPQLGELREARGTLIHSRGPIEVELQRCGDDLQVMVALPDGLEGEFCWQGNVMAVQSGRQRLRCTPRVI